MLEVGVRGAGLAVWTSTNEVAGVMTDKVIVTGGGVAVCISA